MTKTRLKRKPKTQQISREFHKNAKIVVQTMDSLAALRKIPAKSIKLILASPPYNVGKEYEKATALTDYIDSFKPLVQEMVRVLHPKGSICWQVGNFVKKGEVYPLDVFYYQMFKEQGLKLRNRIVWHFGHGLHASKRFSGRYETLLWFTKTDSYTFNLDKVRVPAKYPGKRHYKGQKNGQPSGNPLGKNPSDIWMLMKTEWTAGLWDVPNVKANHVEKTIHPCQFPIEIAERCILATSNKGDWVLDPFCGVGTSLVAAIKHNRRAIGIDKEAKYTRIARRRFEQYVAGLLPYRPIGMPIHKPSITDKVAQVPKEWRRRKKSIYRRP